MRIMPLIVAVTVSAFATTVFADDPAELLRQAETKYAQRSYKEAVELASQVIQGDGAPVEAFRVRAAAYEQLRQFEQAIADLDRYIELRPDSSETYQARGVLHFKAGQIRESIADFDRFLEFHPQREPHHWQRGISHYYAGQYEKGVRQFESHKSVNPQDVENGIWHYLCKARVDGVPTARAALMDITRDSRPWAIPVYRMFQEKATPRQVIEQSEQLSRSEAERKYNLFYAHLYVGLFHEAAGRPNEALKHIGIAVEKYPSTHYMGDVARVHLQLAKEKQK